MGAKKDVAIRNHSSGYSCSSAVLQAFCDDAGLSPDGARRLAGPMAGGARVKCGAVLAAEAVIERHYSPAESKRLVSLLEEKFLSKNQSVNCRELRGLAGKPRLRSCRGCVEDAAEILEEILLTNGNGGAL